MPDNEIRIDTSSREVVLPNDIGAIGVSSDELVRTIRFTVPRFYGEVDLGEGFTFRINYYNPSGEGDIHQVADLEVGNEDIRFSWPLSRFATESPGEIAFAICAIKLEGADIVQEFNSTPATLEVLEGLEVDGPAEFAVRLDWLSSELLRLQEPIDAMEAQREAAEQQRRAHEMVRRGNEATRVARYEGIAGELDELRRAIDTLGSNDEGHGYIYLAHGLHFTDEAATLDGDALVFHGAAFQGGAAVIADDNFYMAH